MKIGFLALCLGNMPLKEKCRWASENGFTSMEIPCWPTDSGRPFTDIDVATLTQEKADEIKEYLKEYNITITSLSYYDNNLYADLTERKKVNDHVMKCIDAAEMLGAGMVGTFAGRNLDKTPEASLDDFEEVFGKLVAYAESKNIKICLENCIQDNNGIPANLAHSPEIWTELFKRVPSNNLGLTFDPSHLEAQLIDSISLLSQFKDKIFQFHAKDVSVNKMAINRYGAYNRQLGEGRRAGYWGFRMPGDGNLDWAFVFEKLREINYDFVATIEYAYPAPDGTQDKVKGQLLESKRHIEQFI